MARAALALLGIAALAYAAVCILLYLQQRSLVYYPQFTRSDPARTDFAIDRGDVVLRGWSVNPGQGDAVLYFGGNAERVEDNRDDLRDRLPGRTAYLPAYRGYGASDGKPGEAALLGDALAIYDMARERHPDGRIAVIGRSLGSAVAAHLAAHREVERLVLVTPFDSMVEVARGHYPWLPVRWLMRERYETTALLRRHRGPVLVLRAGADTVVPPRHADRLVAAMPRAPVVKDFPGAGHNDIHLQPGYGEAISAFLQ